jgi:hypothetical protein
MLLEAHVEMLSSVESAIDARFVRKRAFRQIRYTTGSYHRQSSLPQPADLQVFCGLQHKKSKATGSTFHQTEWHCQGKT